MNSKWKRILLSPDGDGGASGGATPVPVSMASLGGGSSGEPAADTGPDLFATLREELGGAAPAASPDPEPAKPAATPVAKPAAAAKADDSNPDDPYALPAKRKPAAAAGDPAKPAGSDGQKLQGAAALRAELEAAKAELTALKFGKPAGAPAAAPAEAEEVKTLRQQIEAVRAEVKAREEIIHRVSYKESAEFKEKYVAPYHSAFKDAGDYIAQVPLADGSRNGTPEDLARLMRTPPAELGRVATELFGDNAPVVMAYRNQVAMKLSEMRKAETEAATRGQQLKQQEEEQHRTAIEETRRTFQELTKKEMSDEEVWAPDASDPETKTLLDRGQKLVREVFENPEGLPRDAVVARMAKVAARAVGFDNLYRRHQLLAEKHAALEAELAKYRGAEPPSGGSGGAASGDGGGRGQMSLVDELRQTLSGSRR